MPTLRSRLLVLTAAASAAVAAAGSATAQTGDFEWRGTLAQGNTVEVRGINGSVRAVASVDGVVHVGATRQARRGDPRDVRIEVVEHDGGVTICAIYPTPSGADRPNECRPGGGASSSRNSDVRVDFEVRVPAGVNFAGHTVNGGVDARGLRSDVVATTVNGRVEVRTTGFVSRASTVNGDIVLEVPAGLHAQLHASTVNGSIDSDFPITVRGSIGGRSFRGVIGEGGPEIRASTVNGSIRLRQL